MRHQNAFTLIELLIVIAIIAILGSATVIVLDPVDMMKQSRDSQRTQDMNALTKAINITKFNNDNTNYGTVNTVYISVPYDTNTNCDYPTTNPLGLPPIPSGWSYHCSTNANHRKADGTGWIPLDLSSGSGSLSSLPVDPINSTTNSLFYAYYPDSGVYEINTKMESNKYSLAGALDQVSHDGGDDFVRYEMGNDLTIAPWSFEFKNFVATASKNNKLGWYRNTGTASPTLLSDGDGTYARFNGYAWYEWQENIPFNPSATYKIACRYRQISEPSSGGKSFYCGYAGVVADGIIYANRTGSNSWSSQHYHAASGMTQVAGTPFTEYVGYVKGWGSPDGSGSACPNQTSPCLVHQNVRFVRPIFLINYSDGNGIADIDYIHIEKQ